jgi:hypothetical protein
VTDVTQILDRVQAGDPLAASELLPLVYQELRRIAAHKMAGAFAAREHKERRGEIPSLRSLRSFAARDFPVPAFRCSSGLRETVQPRKVPS